jgi:hypothetical protein
MKGSTSCRRFCWPQAKFSFGHETAASQEPTNGCSWPRPQVGGQARKLTVDMPGNQTTAAALRDRCRTTLQRHSRFRIGRRTAVPCALISRQSTKTWRSLEWHRRSQALNERQRRQPCRLRPRTAEALCIAPDRARGLSCIRTSAPGAWCRRARGLEIEHRLADGVGL